MKIVISESKRDEMSGLCEKMLRYGGKLMSCLEELGGDESIGMRGGDWDDDDDDDIGMRNYGMRRGRSSRTGRYTRY